MNTFQEKRESFKLTSDGRNIGNLAVIAPTNNSGGGDGSLSVDGTIYTDTIESATLDLQITTNSAFNFVQTTLPDAPPQGQIQLFSSSSNSSRLFMQNYQGLSIDLNPLQKKGDLMVFDTTTTNRLLVGSQDQFLVVNGSYTGSGIRWKSNLSLPSNVIVPSDTYINYLVLQQTSTSLLLTSTFQSVQFDTIVRADSAFTVDDNTHFTITKPGIYLVTFSVGVGFLNDNVTDVANAMIALQAASLVIASESYSVIVGNVSVTNITCQVLISVVSSTQYTVVCKEVNSSTGTLYIKPDTCVTSINEIRMGNQNTCQSNFVNAANGQIIINSTSDVELTTSSVTSNDTLGSNKITFTDSGKRHLFGKITVSSSNSIVNIYLIKNSTIISTMTESITGLNTSLQIIALVEFTSGDTVSLQVQSSGTITIVNACLGTIMYSSTIDWKTALFTSGSLTLVPIIWNDITFNTFTIDNTYITNSLFPNLIQVSQGGTYYYSLRGSKASGLRLVIDIGNGYIEKCRTNSTSLDGIVYVETGTCLKFQILGTLVNHTSLIFYKYENTISKFLGNSFFTSQTDTSLQMTTATVFIQRYSINVTLANGNYIVQWEFDYDVNAPAGQFFAEIRIDNTKYDEFSSKPVTVGIFKRTSGIFTTTLTSGLHTIALYVKNGGTYRRSLSTRNIALQISNYA
jgi:hypothetical protein